MKKWICALSVFLGCMLCVLPVRADVIWEPQNSFYEKHSSECEYVGRTFTANGPDGEVILYESPVSARKVATWENGHKVHIDFSYKDEKGTLWGVYEDRDKSGWVPMEYMDVVYDHISFAEEYGEKLQKKDGTLDQQYMGKEIYFWSYPASPYQSFVTIGDDLPNYYRIYEDGAGHIWGNVGYYYGDKNVWICLDEPDAGLDALYPDGAPGIGETKPVEKNFTGERITPEGGQGNTVVWVAILVLLVVVLTGGLLFVLKKRGGLGIDDFKDWPPFISGDP